MHSYVSRIEEEGDDIDAMLDNLIERLSEGSDIDDRMQE